MVAKIYENKGGTGFMGHLSGKDVYRRVGEKLDGLEYRAPMNQYLYEALKEIFTTQEAEIFCKMPYGMSTRKSLSRILKIEEAELEKVLYQMSTKGLILDLYVNGEHQYMRNPVAGHPDPGSKAQHP